MERVENMAPRGQMNPPSALEHAACMSELARHARADILIMTTSAGSGHLGGSLSSINIYLALWSFADTSPQMLDDPARDRIVINHGHTAPAVYAALGRLAYFDSMEAVSGFRRHGSVFEGHADPRVPGVEWACGNMVSRAVRVSEMLLKSGVRAGVINLSSPLDLDVVALEKAFSTGFVITYEDHHVRTGIGSLIAGHLADNSVRCRLLRFGVTGYGMSASPEENDRHQGLDPESVAKRILEQTREN